MKSQHILQTGEKAMRFILFGDYFFFGLLSRTNLVRPSKAIWIKKKIGDWKRKNHVNKAKDNE